MRKVDNCPACHGDSRTHTHPFDERSDARREAEIEKLAEQLFMKWTYPPMVNRGGKEELRPLDSDIIQGLALEAKRIARIFIDTVRTEPSA